MSRGCSSTVPALWREEAPGGCQLQPQAMKREAEQRQSLHVIGQAEGMSPSSLPGQQTWPQVFTDYNH